MKPGIDCHSALWTVTPPPAYIDASGLQLAHLCYQIPLIDFGGFFRGGRWQAAGVTIPYSLVPSKNPYFSINSQDGQTRHACDYCPFRPTGLGHLVCNLVLCARCKLDSPRSRAVLPACPAAKCRLYSYSRPGAGGGLEGTFVPVHAPVPELTVPSAHSSTRQRVHLFLIYTSA